jgi:hypothetical protein
MTHDSKSLEHHAAVFANPEINRPDKLSAEKSSLKQKVRRALLSTPGGLVLDQYFGISSTVAQQSYEEAKEGEELLDRLRVVTEGDYYDDEHLLDDISLHVEDSLVDANAIRALMRANRTPKTF